MNKTGFNGYIYDFNTDYNAIAVSDILDIHKYLMKKNKIVQKCLECISMKSQECRVRPEILNINSNNPIFHPFSIKVNKCNGNFQEIIK